MTAVPCTRERLDAAPAGARLIRDFGFGVKLCVHKVSDGLGGDWQYGLDQDVVGGQHTSAASFASVHHGVPVTIHHPAPIEVTALSARDWAWYCRVCGAFVWLYPTAAQAADAARTHLSHHLSHHAGEPS